MGKAKPKGGSRFGGKGQTLKQKTTGTYRRPMLKVRASRRATSLRNLQITDITRTRYVREAEAFFALVGDNLDTSSGEYVDWDRWCCRYVERCWQEGEPLGRASYAIAGIA